MTRLQRAAAGVAAGGLLLLLWVRWSQAGLTPLGAAGAFVVLFGPPIALWLWVEKGPVRRPRRMPRIVWGGLLLVIVGVLGITTGLWATRGAAPTGIAMTSPQSSGRHLVFAPLPAQATSDLKVLFPSYVVGRALRSGGILYEIWLKRPGASTYALELTWVKGGFQVENEAWNTLLHPRPGKALPLKTLRSRLNLKGAKIVGPVVFPGYVLYVSMTADQAVVVDSHTGQPVGGEGW